MLANIPLSEIMTKNVVTVNQDASLFEADKLFAKDKVRHLPVEYYGVLVGMLSLTDLQRMSFSSLAGEAESNSDNALFEMFTVGNIMTHEPVALQANQTVREAAEVLATREFHALPVLDGNELVGIITTTDLLKFMLERTEKESYFLN